MTYFCIFRLGTTNDLCLKSKCEKNFKDCFYLVKNTKDKDRLFDTKNLNKACLYCGNEIERERTRSNFCNRKCYDNYRYSHNENFRRKHIEISKNYARTHRNNPEFKAKRKREFRNWINRDNNRQHYNELVRESNKIRAKERHAERTARGLCIYCGSELPNRDFRTCETCRAKWREQYKKKQEKKYSTENKSARVKDTTTETFINSAILS